ncbi:MAG: hypothetical protein A3J49_04790 [Gallionellales bacterium RIFCSPHIGHO2_02_FULL_57_16]|nr:MAG: hypothetical protein A3J49_04790 [Gallionellales bacterium RIFCSPHIGHO2_02_FULL_57_16]
MLPDPSLNRGANGGTKVVGLALLFETKAVGRADQVVQSRIQPNPAFERAKIARVFPDIIGAEAPNAGVKARRHSI